MLISKKTPLVYLWNGDILFYRCGKLFICNPENCDIKEEVSLNFGWKEKYLSRINIVYRLLRLGIRNALQLDENIIVLFVNKRFYEFNLEAKSISEGFIPPYGVRALYIASIVNIVGFDDMTVFGGYLSNPDKNEVSIYRVSVR